MNVFVDWVSGADIAPRGEETGVSEEGVSVTTIRVSSLRNLYMENVLLRRLRDISSCRLRVTPFASREIVSQAIVGDPTKDIFV